jgi:hypothetical protein
MRAAGGAGGDYSRSVISVTPGNNYTINVGGGGDVAVEGGTTSIQLGGQTLIYARGGLSGEGCTGLGVCPSHESSAAISRLGVTSLFTAGGGTAGGPAFGATFCPGPDGDKTGRGANALDPSGHAFAGYVLLTW